LVPKYNPMPTHKQLSNVIRKLELHEGDILVVSDVDTLQRLRDMGSPPGITFRVPILYAPLGIEKVNVEYLKQFVKEVIAPSIIKPS
jgi:hypothetical protein